MWLYRRILKISYVTNEEVVRRLAKQTEQVNEVKLRKLQYLGTTSYNARQNSWKA